MIQRIQSIFLLIVAICMITVLFLPIWQKENPQSKEKVSLTYIELEHIKAGKLIESRTTIYLTIMASIASILAVLSIISYKSLLQQMKLGMFNSLVMAAMTGLIFYFSYQGEAMLAEPKSGEYLVGFYLIVVALVSNLLANRFIRRDEKLIRSSNRMR